MIIIDVRTKEEFNDGHVEGAINIPVDSIEESNVIKEMKTSEPIALYCRSGARANFAKMILTKQGFTNVTLHNQGRYQ